jgi:hypothetical protein
MIKLMKHLNRIVGAALMLMFGSIGCRISDNSGDKQGLESEVDWLKQGYHFAASVKNSEDTKNRLKKEVVDDLVKRNEIELATEFAKTISDGRLAECYIDFAEYYFKNNHDELAKLTAEKAAMLTEGVKDNTKSTLVRKMTSLVSIYPLEGPFFTPYYITEQRDNDRKEIINHDLVIIYENEGLEKALKDWKEISDGGFIFSVIYKVEGYVELMRRLLAEENELDYKRVASITEEYISQFDSLVRANVRVEFLKMAHDCIDEDWIESSVKDLAGLNKKFDFRDNATAFFFYRIALYSAMAGRDTIAREAIADALKLYDNSEKMIYLDKYRLMAKLAEVAYYLDDLPLLNTFISNSLQIGETNPNPRVKAMVGTEVCRVVAQIGPKHLKQEVVDRVRALYDETIKLYAQYPDPH